MKKDISKEKRNFKQQEITPELDQSKAGSETLSDDSPGRQREHVGSEGVAEDTDDELEES